MDKKENNKQSPNHQESDELEQEFPGYPLYPKKDDIYNRSKEEQDIDPEEISHLKDVAKRKRPWKNNEKDFVDDESGDDLDVPGSELDDEGESTGSEDEENNYYSLGGDNHNDLEEDKGE